MSCRQSHSLHSRVQGQPAMHELFRTKRGLYRCSTDSLHLAGPEFRNADMVASQHRESVHLVVHPRLSIGCFRQNVTPNNHVIECHNHSQFGPVCNSGTEELNNESHNWSRQRPQTRSQTSATHESSQLHLTCASKLPELGSNLTATLTSPVQACSRSSNPLSCWLGLQTLSPFPAYMATCY